MLIQTIQLGDKVEIAEQDYIKSDKADVNIWGSSIQEIIDNVTWIISAPLDNGSIVPLEEQRSYIIYVYTNKGLYQGKIRVNERYKEDRLHLIKVSLIIPMKKIQRRQYYRLECLQNIKFLVDEKQWCEGVVLDISGGGLRFTSKEKLKKGDTITCLLELPLKEDAMLKLNGKVLLSEYNIDENHYEIRIKFFKISNYDRETIIQYIFHEQRKRRQKEKGLI